MDNQCRHIDTNKEEQKAIFDRNSKVLYKIYSKLNTFIKTGDKVLGHENYNFIVQIVMRELNKHKLYGFEKKDLCIQIMALLLDTFGLPHLLSFYTAEATVAAIDYIYSHNFHRFKKRKKWF